jgi:hypothetical protein
MFFNTCPICETAGVEFLEEYKATDYLGIKCIVCGKFITNRSSPISNKQFDKKYILLVSHYIRRGYENSKRPQVLTIEKINKIVLCNEFYKPTLKKLGYELFRLDDEPKAGSITNRMRVAIKESKFVIADLSYENRGAYWEAGFGEGLGKHVIYSVNESTLDKDHHFDVQGQQAVIWTADNMDKAAQDLEACVKATFF